MKYYIAIPGDLYATELEIRDRILDIFYSFRSRSKPYIKRDELINGLGVHIFRDMDYPNIGWSTDKLFNISIIDESDNNYAE